MALCKTAVTHWSYCSLALSHRHKGLIFSVDTYLSVNSNNQSPISCCYNMVQYDLVHTILQWQHGNINQRLNPHHMPYISPSWDSFGMSIVGLRVKLKCVIMAPLSVHWCMSRFPLSDVPGVCPCLCVWLASFPASIHSRFHDVACCPVGGWLGRSDWGHGTARRWATTPWGPGKGWRNYKKKIAWRFDISTYFSEQYLKKLKEEIAKEIAWFQNFNIVKRTNKNKFKLTKIFAISLCSEYCFMSAMYPWCRNLGMMFDLLGVSCVIPLFLDLTYCVTVFNILM